MPTITDIYPLNENIAQTLNNNEICILAIDGRGGSGKSTLAKEIASQFPATQVINTDDYFDFEKLSKEEHFWDKNSFQSDILIPLTRGEKGNYRKNIWLNNQYTGAKENTPILPKGLIIVEGLLSLHSDLITYYNSSLWLELSMEKALNQAKHRDIIEKNWDPKEVDNNWEKWIPIQEAYIKEQKPDSNAQWILNLE